MISETVTLSLSKHIILSAFAAIGVCTSVLIASYLIADLFAWHRKRQLALQREHEKQLREQQARSVLHLFFKPDGRCYLCDLVSTPEQQFEHFKQHVEAGHVFRDRREI